MYACVYQGSCTSITSTLEGIIACTCTRHSTVISIRFYCMGVYWLYSPSGSSQDGHCMYDVKSYLCCTGCYNCCPKWRRHNTHTMKRVQTRHSWWFGSTFSKCIKVFVVAVIAVGDMRSWISSVGDIFMELCTYVPCFSTIIPILLILFSSFSYNVSM